MFTPGFNYSFHHPYKSELNMSFINEGFGHRLNPIDGFELYYRTLIEGWNTSDCTSAIPETHESYDLYGGIQSYISMDLPRHIARYNLQKRWLDTLLDGGDWETNAFQFYVGDLYDAIPETMKLAPRTRISGGCNANDDSFFGMGRFNF